MRPQSYSPFKCLPWKKYMYTVYCLYTTKNDIEFDLIDTCKRQIISSSWILTNHTQEPWTYEPSNLIILPLVPYRAHLRPAVLALLVAKPARRPGSHPESQSSEPRAQNMRQSNCCKTSSLNLPFPHGLIQNNISSQFLQKRPKMTKIYQNTMYTMTTTIQSTVRLTDAASLVGSQWQFCFGWSCRTRPWDPWQLTYTN